MKAPERLLESSQNAGVRELLGAGLIERPRPAALRSTALALGISSSVVAASTTASAAAVTSAAPSLALIAAKWVALGTLGGVALAGSASLVSDWSAPRAPVTAPQRVRSTSAATAAPVTVSASPIVEAAPEIVTPPSPKPIGAKPASITTTPSGPASASLPAAQSLSREIALIDGSRRALGAGNAAAALQQLDEYASLARTGTLDREAQLLRIDALSQSGQRAAALALAQRYLASYPNDPHAARLRALAP